MMIKSYAKINLGLKIVKKEVNGYHSIESVMAPISLFDDVIIKLTKSGVKVYSDNEEVPNNKDNIVYKAIEAFKSVHNFVYGVDVMIIKRIPMMAGLGGGSSNAAAVIKGLNILLDTRFDDDKLILIASKVGSDVPFFIKNTMCEVTGIGDKIEKVKSNINPQILLIKPDGGVSTKEAYALFNEKQTESKEYNIRKFLEANDYKKLTANLFNDLEDPAIELCPDIKRAIKDLKACGFDYVGLSGSGSCVYGLTLDRKIAQVAYDNLKNAYEFCKIVHFIC